MANKIWHKDLLMNPHAFLFNLSVVVLVWFFKATTTASTTSLGHQLVPVAVAEGGGGSSYRCIDKEREALLHFKAQLQDPLGQLSTWKLEEDCCKWRGVTCNNHTGHIIQLNLSCPEFYLHCLVGEISPSLVNLTYLNLLDLSHNSFNEPIPMSIGSLTELRHLDLSVNRFNGTIPTSIGSLTKLRHLDLSGSRFNGTIPRSIGSLTELRYLDLSGNVFNGTIPTSIGSLTELRYLDLSGTCFNGTIPTSIGSLSELRYLDLSGTCFNGTIPTSIGSLTELRYLDLSNSLLNGTVPTELGNLTNLEYLSLDCDLSSGYLERYTIENLDWLSHLSQLQSLSMDVISLAKANYWVNAILSLHKLSHLSLNRCDLSKVMHPYSSSLNSSSSSSSSSIVELHLRDNNLNSSMYHWLFPLTSDKLQALDLSYNMLDGIPKYLGNLCSLANLDLQNNSLVVKFPDFLSNLSGCTSATLQNLDASFNQFRGSLPDEIQMFSSLKSLNLDHNQLNGSISEKVWELPKLYYLDLSSNSLRGATISENIGKSKLRYISLSKSSLQGVPPKAHMSNLSYVEEIHLSSCRQLGPHFPKWILSLKNLTLLDISNTGISDTIPVEFWNMWPSQLIHLNMSSNNITGTVPDLLTNFVHEYFAIDLSSNNFYGLIPNVSSALEILDLSGNKFSGGISFLCHITDGFLEYLDLSNNSLTGKIPNCLWNLKELIVLNLGYNDFSGSIPPSVESLINLEGLYLNNNKFSGEVPFSLKNCTCLKFLDLSNNRFSGFVPFWIGENLSGLYGLRLTSNKFFGTIPLQLCQLVNLQILDLSMNNINGTIPSCVTNLTAMVQDGFSTGRNIHYYLVKGDNYISGDLREYLDHATINWQGRSHELTSTLGLVKIIDLSSNNITGQIPYELTHLHQLLVLNLSDNALRGKIPQQIGQMKKLLTLDLSRNNLSGGIPSSLAQVDSLNDLNVSYNNLSGRIPSGTQLQSFEPSRYIGNAGLCGPPVTKYCPGDEELEVPQAIGESEDDVENVWFYIGGATGFAIGFWTVCSILLLNRHVRHAFSHFHDSFENWVYVKVAVFIAKTQRVAQT